MKHYTIKPLHWKHHKDGSWTAHNFTMDCRVYKRIGSAPPEASPYILYWSISAHSQATYFDVQSIEEGKEQAERMYEHRIKYCLIEVVSE